MSKGDIQPLSSTHMPNSDSLLQAVEEIQQLLIARATGQGEDQSRYAVLRRALLAGRPYNGIVPEFVRRCRELDHFWAYIKDKFGSYRERRVFIYQEFYPLVDALERGGFVPADATVGAALADLDETHVHDLWKRALERRASDPEGAITLSRTLLESVCKLIITDAGGETAPDADLPKLYRAAAELLSLAPDQHSEKIFKQILGSCQSVVEGLGAVRNRLSDAHGRGRAPARPQARHAELAVNLAGAMATFLVATWRSRSDHNSTPQS